jgi:tRNA 2-selenouridine synthase
MISEITIEEYFSKHNDLPIIDVRSPVEFQKGHISHAHNIPIFSDEERAHIGTVYAKQSPEKAMKIGYEYIQPKLENFIIESEKIAPLKEVAVHCWRGGMRSHAFAEHLSANGFDKVYLLTGGYKAYRNYVINSFSKAATLFIIGGFTGSGKTEILNLLREDGFQIIDLEGLAHHKGSAFGGIGKLNQPTSEQFENNLFQEWNKLDFSKKIFLEDESFSIGSVNLTMALYKKMCDAPLLFIDIPKEERAKFLVSEYANIDKQALANALGRISKRLGDENTKTALEFLEKENYFEVAMITLKYYDKAYQEVLEHRVSKNIFTIKLNNTDHRENAMFLKKYFETIIYE